MTGIDVVPLVDEGLGNSTYLVDGGDGRALVVDASRDLRTPNASKSAPSSASAPPSPANKPVPDAPRARGESPSLELDQPARGHARATARRASRLTPSGCIRWNRHRLHDGRLIPQT